LQRKVKHLKSGQNTVRVVLMCVLRGFTTFMAVPSNLCLEEPMRREKTTGGIRAKIGGKERRLPDRGSQSFFHCDTSPRITLQLRI
jgi:hypothetical protein